MSTLNLFRINLAILQPKLYDGLPKYGTPNLYEKLFSVFLFDGLGSFTASNFFTTTSILKKDNHYVKAYFVGDLILNTKI